MDGGSLGISLSENDSIAPQTQRHNLKRSDLKVSLIWTYNSIFCIINRSVDIVHLCILKKKNMCTGGFVWWLTRRDR